MQSLELTLAQLAGLNRQQSAEASAALLLSQVRQYIDQGITGGYVPSILVAANNSSSEAKAAAGPAYTCDGVADEATILAAYAAAKRVVLAAGNYQFSSTLVLNQDYQHFLGAGSGLTILEPPDANTSVLRVGNSAGTQSSHQTVGGFTALSKNAGTVAGVEIYGARHLTLEDVFADKGKYPVSFRYVSRFRVKDCRFRNPATGGAAILILGQSGEGIGNGLFERIETFIGTGGGVLGIRNEIVGGGTEDEIDPLVFLDSTLDGNNQANTVALSVENGFRGLAFIGGSWARNKAALIDMTPADVNTQVTIACLAVNFWGTSGNRVADAFKFDQTRQRLALRNCRINQYQDLFYVVANNPRIIVEGLEMANGDNAAGAFIRCDAGSPDFIIDDVQDNGPSPAAKVAGAGTPHIRGRDNRYLVTRNSGTGTIVNPATSVVVAHGLDVTPTIDDITVTLAENPTNDPGDIWVDTIGAANFTVNCRNAPGASDLDFGWKAEVL